MFAESAVLATAFTAIGLTCDSGLASTLTRSVGESRARELVLLGEPSTPAQAVAWGIAGRVVPPSGVAASARELAARLAAGPTAAYAETKWLVAEAWDTDLATTLEAEARAQARLALTADHAAAVEAFLTKRRPEFTGT